MLQGPSWRLHQRMSEVHRNQEESRSDIRYSLEYSLCSRCSSERSSCRSRCRDEIVKCQSHTAEHGQPQSTGKVQGTLTCCDRLLCKSQRRCWHRIRRSCPAACGRRADRNSQQPASALQQAKMSADVENSDSYDQALSSPKVMASGKSYSSDSMRDFNQAQLKSDTSACDPVSADQLPHPSALCDLAERSLFTR